MENNTGKIREVTSFLKAECNLFRRRQQSLKKSNNDKCAVIVEPRKHELLEPVIRNLFDKLDGWNLHIFCGQDNLDYVESLLPDWEYKITALDSHNLNEDEYNKLLKKKSFWEEIEEENVLIFQVDCVFFEGFCLDELLDSDYSYVGSPYNFGQRDENGTLVEDALSPPQTGFNMNGGLSFRRKTEMLRCLNEVGMDQIIEFRKDNNLPTDAFEGSVIAEDVFFNNSLSLLGEKLPSIEVAQKFFCQHEYADIWKSSFAVHNWDKQWGCWDDTVRWFLDRHQAGKPKLCIYAGYGGEPFNGSNYSGKKGVRGSEIAFIKIAEQLTSKYDVYVSGPTIQEGVYNNVKYFNSSKLQWFLEHADIEIMIVNRYVHFFLEFSNTAKKTYIWLHDMCYQNWWQGKELPDGGKHVVANVYDSIDGFICLSDWHIDNIMNLYGIPRNRIFKIGNGIEPGMFDKYVKKKKNKFIYSSLPERGLSILVDWFPSIVKELPDAELHVFTDEAPEDLVLEMENTDGVVHHGKVPYETMIDEFMSSDIWLYPNVFLETFCTSALEAQASRCICVTRDHGSLGEVVGEKGVLVRGDPYSQEFKEKTLKKLFNILNNREEKEKMQNLAQEWAIQKSWAGRSLEWIEMFEK